MTISEYTLGGLFNDTESNFQSFGEIDNPYYRYLNAIAKQQIPGGVNLIGALNEKARTLWEQTGAGEIADHIMAPGNRNISTGDGEMYKVGLGLPIDYDVWYLFYAGDLFKNSKPDDYELDEWIDKCLDERLEDYIAEIDSTMTLKPLKQPDEAEAKSIITLSGGTADGFSGMSGGPISSDNSDGWQYVIKEARFETMVRNYGVGVSPLLGGFTATDSPYWPSKEGVYDSRERPPQPLYGPKEPDSDPYCGYIAFPVGPLGVMWSISVATESSLSNGTGTSVHPADYETQVVQGNELLPPFELAQSENAGEKLIKRGYLVEDNSVLELTAEKFDDIDNPPLHQWLRYWIRADNDMIVPGELVAMLCRPWPLHCWWYQESAPFIYAGNWIETEFYTSGVVKCVLEAWTDPDSDPPSIGKTDTSGYYKGEDWDFESGAKLYVVWVKHEEIIVSSSDWLEYEEDERVGLLKCVRDGGEDAHTSAVGSVDAMAGTGDKFDWESLKWFKTELKSSRDETMFTKEWQIVPVDFYGTGGNSVGGV